MSDSQVSKIELVADAKTHCGEGPIWDVDVGRLIWTDIDGGRVYALAPETGEWSALNEGLVVAGIALHESGDLVFAGSSEIHLWRDPDRCLTLKAEDAGEPVTFNDIIADPQGRLYTGTVYWGADGMEKTGKLYLIDTEGSLRVVDEGLELSNGLGFSPDDRTLYYADSAARRIYAYDVDAESGDLTNKRVFVQVPRDEGIPDGLTVDAEGFVWSAQWYGSQVVRYDPDGKVERRLAMPVTQVSSVAFGGPDLKDLYITTAGDSWPSPLAPPGYDFNAANTGGSLYRVRLDVKGRLEHGARLSFPSP